MNAERKGQCRMSTFLQVRLPLEISVLSMGLTIYDYLEIKSDLRTKINFTDVQRLISGHNAPLRQLRRSQPPPQVRDG